ncbi:hypothetical protein SAMN05660493_00614 [Epilithonimonas bovis DSM 19482]|uniref:Uncharacterized protein n=1 Tax=Epilithonimonas bovis DSM 19482 TaxID=1121284 RepID=A0A1U7PTW2_9FLAO|nr:hypothetical protein SAMN05660493_00614 [Epilithonimonas bovis DSM 19482]
MAAPNKIIYFNNLGNLATGYFSTCVNQLHPDFQAWVKRLHLNSPCFPYFFPSIATLS